MSEPGRDVAAALARMRTLHPKLIDLSLDRIDRLLAQLGRPELALPPVIHVAGTNGKGSTAAFLRAIGEAAGLRVHVMTSPHLVRFNERTRLAGALIADEHLAEVLARCEAANAGAGITVFEIATAASFLAMAEVPADLAVIEVGLGGRYDATNVVRPAVSVITPIDYDHAEFLGTELVRVAGEKAGIIKPGAPVVVAHQREEAFTVIEAEAARTGSPLVAAGREWDAWAEGGRLLVQSGQRLFDLPAAFASRRASVRQCGPGRHRRPGAGRRPHRRGRAGAGRGGRGLGRAAATPDRRPAGGPRQGRRGPTCGSTAATTPTPPAPWPPSRAA